MTLPASGSITMAQINVELGRASNAADSLNDSWVRALAQKSSGALSFNDLHGKTGRFDGNVTTGAISHARSIDWNNGVAPFFDSSLEEVVWTSSSGASLFLWAASTHYTGNILVKNNSTGVSAVFTPQAQPGFYLSSDIDANDLIRIGASDNFTILPSN